MPRQGGKLGGPRPGQQGSREGPDEATPLLGSPPTTAEPRPSSPVAPTQPSGKRLPVQSISWAGRGTVEARSRAERQGRGVQDWTAEGKNRRAHSEVKETIKGIRKGGLQGFLGQKTGPGFYEELLHGCRKWTKVCQGKPLPRGSLGRCLINANHMKEPPTPSQRCSRLSPQQLPHGGL